MSDRKKAKGTGDPQIAGTVRVREQGREFPADFAAGDVAVIDAVDLDRKAASELLLLKPGAVLNSQASTTGRSPSMGAQLLVESGVVLIDDLGPDVGALRDGDRIVIVGAGVFRGPELVASGVRRTREGVQRARSQGRERLGAGVRAFAAASAEHFGREEDLILHGQGLPDVTGIVGRSNVLVIAGIPDGVDTRALRRLIADQSMVIIAAGVSGLEAVGRLRERPALIVGDPGSVDDQTLGSSGGVVLLERPDGRVPGAKKMRERGLDFFTVATSLTDLDVALLIAAGSEATLIVESSHLADLETLVDAGGAAFSGAFFIRAELTDRLVGLKAALRLARPALTGWVLALMAVAAVLVMVAAVFFTPWGASLWGASPWGASPWSHGGDTMTPVAGASPLSPIGRL